MSVISKNDTININKKSQWWLDSLGEILNKVLSSPARHTLNFYVNLSSWFNNQGLNGINHSNE